MKKYFFIAIVLTLLISGVAFAETSNNFILDQVWYSNDLPKEGETIKIYTAIWNGNNDSLAVKVEFYDKNVILGTRDVVVAPQKIQEVSVSWKVTKGDHSISAKVLSATLSTKDGKKAVNLDPKETNTDRKFISVVVDKDNGEPVSGDEIAKGEINKFGEKIEGMVPESVNETVKESIGYFDVFRTQTLTKILDSKENTELKISEYEEESSGLKPQTLESATERPIAQVKLFFLKILKFIFENKSVFYALIIITLFYVLRSLYRKIRNR
ncbi:MAG: hypothetical protein PHT84_02075 [Candidatus Pacebacteria bacterium]|nr:hypothetical protein [Candidatus Paceibacterota bacterium]